MILRYKKYIKGNYGINSNASNYHCYGYNLPRGLTRKIIHGYISVLLFKIDFDKERKRIRNHPLGIKIEYI